jgi:hypothetical protein
MLESGLPPRYHRPRRLDILAISVGGFYSPALAFFSLFGHGVARDWARGRSRG